MTKSFDDYYEESKAPEINPIYSAAAGFNAGVEELTQGTLQLAGQALGMDTFLAKLGKYRARKQAEYEVHSRVNPWSTGLGYAGGIVSSAAPLGIAAAQAPAAGIAAAASRAATGGAAMAGLTYASDPATRAANMIAGGTVGAAIPFLGRGVGKGISALRGQSSGGMRNQVVRDVAESLQSSGTAGQAFQQFDEAAKMGVHLNPAQASGNRLLGAMTSRIPKDIKTQQRVANILTEEEGAGRSLLSQMMKKVVPQGYEKTAQMADELYTKVGSQQYGDDIKKLISNDDTLNVFLGKLRNNKELAAEWGMNKVGKGTIAEAHKLKEFLYRRAGTEGSASGNLKRAAGELDTLLKKNPEVAQADLMYSQVKAYDDLAEGLQKIGQKPGQNILDDNFDALYKKLFGTPELQNKYTDIIQRIGGDAEHSKNVIQLLNNMRNNPIGKVVGKKVDDVLLEEVPGIGARALNMFTRFKQGRYNKQILDVYMDPKWKSKVEAVLQNKDPVKQASGMLDLLETSGSVAATVGTAAEDTKAIMQGKPVAELPGVPKEMSSQAQVGTQAAPSAAPGQSDFEKALGGESYIHPAKKDATITEVPMDQRDMRLSQDFSASYPQQAIQKTMSQRGVNMDHPAVQLANRIPVPNPQDYDNDNQYINAVNDYYNEYTSVAYELYDAPHVPLNPENRL